MVLEETVNKSKEKRWFPSQRSFIRTEVMTNRLITPVSITENSPEINIIS